MNWLIGSIEPHLEGVTQLFSKTEGHRHVDNYIKWPLFQHTKFARMAYDPHMIYYSAGISRPEYQGGIRIMSRHTRDRSYDFGGIAADLKRGKDTLDQSVAYAIELGYADIWVSREENPKLLEYFQKVSDYDWSITHTEIPCGGMQWVLQLVIPF